MTNEIQSCDRLSAEEIAAFLADAVPAESIHVHPVIDSTNTEAKRLAAAGCPHNTVVLAEEQTGGKGRLGRSFFSPKGSGIYLNDKVGIQKSLPQLFRL